MTTHHQRRRNHDHQAVIQSRSAAVTSHDGTLIGYQTLGSGEHVILLGGTLRVGDDYLPLARLLAKSLMVHVMDRRGRGASGPQGAAYSIEKECQDVLAVQQQTGAQMLFGHSYGGLIALETARRTGAFGRVAVYEPGVSVAGSMPVGWLGEYRRLLAAGDTRGAFAVMAQGAGDAPALLAQAPLGLVRALMYCLPKTQWRGLEPLLPTALAENEQIAMLDAPDASRFASITARVFLLGGAKSPAAITTRALRALHEVIPGSQLQLLDGLRHTAPEQKAPEAVADAVTRFLGAPENPGSASDAARPTPTESTLIDDLGGTHER